MSKTKIAKMRSDAARKANKSRGAAGRTLAAERAWETRRKLARRAARSAK